MDGRIHRAPGLWSSRLVHLTHSPSAVRWTRQRHGSSHPRVREDPSIHPFPLRQVDGWTDHGLWQGRRRLISLIPLGGETDETKRPIARGLPKQKRR